MVWRYGAQWDGSMEHSGMVVSGTVGWQYGAQWDGGMGHSGMVVSGTVGWPWLIFLLQFPAFAPAKSGKAFRYSALAQPGLILIDFPGECTACGWSSPEI